MPIYDFHLEAQDGSGHFRQGVTEAESRQDALDFLEKREARIVAFELSEEHEAELEREYGAAGGELPAAAPRDASEEEKAEFRRLRVKHRAWLNAHRQTQPYALVYLKKRKGT
jgi:type II secretory pathway component PulF